MRDLIGQFLELGIAPVDLMGVALDTSEQPDGQLTQFSLASCSAAMCGASGMAAMCRVPCKPAPLADSLIAVHLYGHSDLHNADDPGLPNPLPRQAEHECIELLARERLRRPASAARPDEVALMQPPCRQPDANAVMDENLQTGRAPVGKDIRR